MKQKGIMVCCALLSLLILAGCDADSPVKSISKAEKIEILVAETDETIVVTDKEDVRHICDNLVSLKLRKMEHSDPTILVYRLRFYDAGGEQLEVIDIPADNWIGWSGDIYFYSVAGGEFDRGYINEIVNQYRTNT